MTPFRVRWLSPWLTWRSPPASVPAVFSNRLSGALAGAFVAVFGSARSCEADARAFQPTQAGMKEIVR